MNVREGEVLFKWRDHTGTRLSMYRMVINKLRESARMVPKQGTTTFRTVMEGCLESKKVEYHWLRENVVAVFCKMCWLHTGLIEPDSPFVYTFAWMQIVCGQKVGEAGRIANCEWLVGLALRRKTCLFLVIFHDIILLPPPCPSVLVSKSYSFEWFLPHAQLPFSIYYLNEI